MLEQRLAGIWGDKNNEQINPLDDANEMNVVHIERNKRPLPAIF